MHKKGQFFLVFAIVIIFFLFLMTATYNSAWSMVEIENFEELNDNFAYEQDVVINKAIYDGTDVAVELDNFGTTFSAYSGTVDPNYGFYQIYQDPNTGVIYIQNFLSNGKTITLSGESLTGEEVVQLTVASLSTGSVGTIALDVGGQILEESVEVPLVNYDDESNQVALDLEDTSWDLLEIQIEGVEVPAGFLRENLAEDPSATGSFSYDGDDVEVFIDY